MSCKDYQVDEVIRSLSKKGVIVTLNQPITKSVTKTYLPDQGVLEERFQKFVSENKDAVSADLSTHGVEIANDIWGEKFQQKYPQLFLPRTVKETVVAQPPFTVNTAQAHDLGNGSWGKIDFLTKHKSFKLMTHE